MNKADQNVFVFGAGGHAKVVIDAIEKQAQSRVSYVVDDEPGLSGKDFFGYTIIGGRSELLQFISQSGSVSGIVAIGSNTIRADVADWLTSNAIGLATIVHPSAQISRGVSLGEGTAVFGGAIVNADSIVGKNVILNTGATVDHDCIIGDLVHVSPGVHLCGGVRIGNRSFIGAGSTIIPGVKIGNNVVIGAGSTVLNDVTDNMKVAGSPAKEICKR